MDLEDIVLLMRISRILLYSILFFYFILYTLGDQDGEHGFGRLCVYKARQTHSFLPSLFFCHYPLGD